MKILFIRVLVSFMLLIFLSAVTDAQMMVRIRPVPPVYVRQVAPSPANIWVDGQWMWHGGHYEYINGYWMKPARGSAWVPGYWRHSHRGWLWKPGYWKRGRC